jgi:hypothetical protein
VQHHDVHGHRPLIRCRPGAVNLSVNAPFEPSARIGYIVAALAGQAA